MNLSVQNRGPIDWPQLQERPQEVKIQNHLGFALDLLVVILKMEGQRDWEGKIGPLGIGDEYFFTPPPGFIPDRTQIGLLFNQNDLIMNNASKEKEPHEERSLSLIH